MTHNTSLDRSPSDTLKLLRRLDVLGTVLAFAWLAVVFFEGTPGIIRWSVFVAFFCVSVGRFVIQRKSGVSTSATGSRTAGYLMIAVAVAFAAVWWFPVGMRTNLLLLAVIPLTLGVGEYFRWRARTRN